MIIFSEQFMTDLHAVNEECNTNPDLTDDADAFFQEATITTAEQSITYKEMKQPSAIDWSNQRVHAKKQDLLDKGYGPDGLYVGLYTDDTGTTAPVLTVDVSTPEKAVTYVLTHDSSDILPLTESVRVEFRETSDGQWVRIVS